jgi:hypothetical protein
LVQWCCTTNISTLLCWFLQWIFFKVIQKRPCVLIWPGERIAKNKNTIIMYR